MIYSIYKDFYAIPNSAKSFSYLYNANKQYWLDQGVVVTDNIVRAESYKTEAQNYKFATVDPGSADLVALDNDLVNHCGLNDVEVLSVQEAIDFLSNNTTCPLKEGTTNTFIITPAGTDPDTGEPTPEVLLTIE